MSVAGSSPTTSAITVRPSAQLRLDSRGAVDDVAVREREAVGRDDHARAARELPAAVADRLDVEHGAARPVGERRDLVGKRAEEAHAPIFRPAQGSA